MKETNMEHYRGEIEAVGHNFALINGKVVKCNRCVKCDFETEPDEEWESCTIKRVRWLMSEYKPEPVLTEREKHFVEFVQEGWLARDKNNTIFWHGAEPKKYDHSWGNDCLKYARVDTYDREIFPFITWEDEEPWSVEELRKLKVLEYNPEDVAFKDGDVE